MELPAASDYDVVVAGARIAGSTVATRLGDLGVHVLLVDAFDSPRATLSTHFFRGNGLVAVLAQLEVLDEVRALGPPPLVKQYHYQDGRPDFVVGPAHDPGELGFNLSVRREPLDTLLLRRAVRRSNVEFLGRTRVTGILKEDGTVVGAFLEGPGGRRKVRTRLLVGADGRHSAVARGVGAAVQQGDPPSRALYYRYVTGFVGPGGTLDGPEFSLRGDEMAYVFPSDQGRTCIALTLNLSTFQWFKEDPELRFRTILARHTGLWPRFQQATPDGPLWGCGPEPNYVRVPCGPGWALVGDAGLHQDPWTGLGMDNAGRHGAFLAEAVARWLQGGESQQDALAGFHQKRDKHALERYRETVRLARDLTQLDSGAQGARSSD